MVPGSTSDPVYCGDFNYSSHFSGVLCRRSRFHTAAWKTVKFDDEAASRLGR